MKKLLSVLLFSPVLIMLTSCASTPKVLTSVELEKVCPEPSLYQSPIPDGLTDEMTLEELTVALSVALGQANADRAQVASYCASVE